MVGIAPKTAAVDDHGARERRGAILRAHDACLLRDARTSVQVFASCTFHARRRPAHFLEGTGRAFYARASIRSGVSRIANAGCQRAAARRSVRIGGTIGAGLV